MDIDVRDVIVVLEGNGEQVVNSDGELISFRCSCRANSLALFTKISSYILLIHNQIRPLPQKRTMKFWFLQNFKTKFSNIVEGSKSFIFYGWIPLILIIGYIKCETKPSFLRLINPLS